MPFLPITEQEMRERGWERPDFIIVTGDAYVDHPSFGTAIVSRVLEHAGYRICIVPQPQSDADYRRFGAPRYGFFINGGNIDSMVAHYTAAKKRRSEDAYSPGGRAGRRPDRATIVYIPKPCAVSFPPYRLPSAALKRRYAALLTTIIGTTACAPPFCWTRAPIC